MMQVLLAPAPALMLPPRPAPPPPARRRSPPPASTRPTTASPPTRPRRGCSWCRSRRTRWRRSTQSAAPTPTTPSPPAPSSWTRAARTATCAAPGARAGPALRGRPCEPWAPPSRAAQRRRPSRPPPPPPPQAAAGRCQPRARARAGPVPPAALLVLRGRRQLLRFTAPGAGLRCANGLPNAFAQLSTRDEASTRPTSRGAHSTVGRPCAGSSPLGRPCAGSWRHPAAAGPPPPGPPTPRHPPRLPAGPLPPSLAQSNIKYLHLGGNALTGGAALPPAVVTANLSSNRLSGELADSVSRDLQSIDLSRDQLSGSVPATLANYRVRACSSLLRLLLAALDRMPAPPEQLHLRVPVGQAQDDEHVEARAHGRLEQELRLAAGAEVAGGGAVAGEAGGQRGVGGAPGAAAAQPGQSGALAPCSVWLPLQLFGCRCCCRCLAVRAAARRRDGSGLRAPLLGRARQRRKRGVGQGGRGTAASSSPAAPGEGACGGVCAVCAHPPTL